MIDPVAQAFPTPALRKVREGRGTRRVGDANEIKSLGHPPDLGHPPRSGAPGRPPFFRPLKTTLQVASSLPQESRVPLSLGLER